MKTKFYLFLVPMAVLLSCSNNNSEGKSNEDTTTQGVINAEGTETNAYNLPGADTAAIHENTTTPGVLDKDASDSTRQQ
jgi:hypothetical protein